MTNSDGQESVTVTIKKYANRRLYNTATSSYVTLEHLCQMVKDGIDFVVFDAKSGEDITRSVLTQIIVEEESKGQNLLPISFLRQLIGYYGDNMQHMLLPRYLEHSMDAFTQNQDQMQSYFRDTFGPMFPAGSFEDMGKQNMAAFENAMKMFSPLTDGAPPETPPERPTEKPPERAETAPKPEEANASKSQIDEMERKLNELQAQIATMTKPAR
ncbi:MAG: polyhydroxyalkanoate synthesis repressor PhaR [Alphaproteobacteria bacterium]|nr:polyhydroxyalkanoate synthesis repressor PhaR [Alphaproteobacteria bacterium]